MWLLSVFKWVLYSTTLGSVMVLLILLLKLLVKEKLGVRWNYCVWLILLIRLLVPNAPESSLSAFNIVNLAENKASQIKYLPDYTVIKATVKSNEEISFSDLNQKPKDEIQKTYIQTKGDKTKIALGKDNKPSKEFYYLILTIIWLIGAAALALYTIIMTIDFSLKLKKQKIHENKELINILRSCKDAIDIKKDIRILNTNLVRTPAIYGIFRPKLLLPIGISEQLSMEEMKYIILHEMAHIKRKDIIISCITGILQIVHWFNPLLWYGFYKMRQDRELACDALALSCIDSNTCREYGNTILKLLQNYKKTEEVYGMACIINNKSQIKRRITMISLFKKNSYRWSAAPLIVLIVMGAVMLTNGKDSSILAVNKNQVEVKGNINKEGNDKLEDQSIILENINDKNFSGKLLTIKNPKKVVVGYSKQINKSTETTRQIAEDNNAVCAINAGEFEGILNDINTCTPKGFIIHDGKTVYNASKSENDIYNVAGFDNDGKLIVGEHSLAQLNKIGAKEAVVSGVPLIINGKAVKLDNELGVDSRTIIGQKADGSVIFMVIEGRRIKSAGAALSDVQNILLQNGVHNASNLRGGGHSIMYYNGSVISQTGAMRLVAPSTFMVLH